MVTSGQWILAFWTRQPGSVSLTPVMMICRPQLFTALQRSKAKRMTCGRGAHCQKWSKGSVTKLTGKQSFCYVERSELEERNIECAPFVHTCSGDILLAERLVKPISSCKVSLAGAFQTGSGAPSVLFS